MGSEAANYCDDSTASYLAAASAKHYQYNNNQMKYNFTGDEDVAYASIEIENDTNSSSLLLLNGSTTKVEDCTRPVQLIFLFIETFFLLLSLILEGAMILLALRGSILDEQPRRRMPLVIYSHFGLLVVEVLWSVFCFVWLHFHHETPGREKLIGEAHC